MMNKRISVVRSGNVNRQRRPLRQLSTVLALLTWMGSLYEGAGYEPFGLSDASKEAGGPETTLGHGASMTGQPLDSPGTWHEKDGYVVFEAEEGWMQDPSESRWELKSDFEGYSGRGYVKWTGPTLVGEHHNPVPYDQMEEGRILRYRIRITRPGVYYWRVRNLHFKEDGDNDCFVSFNRGPFKKTYDWDTQQFTWDETGTWRNRSD